MITDRFNSNEERKSSHTYSVLLHREIVQIIDQVLSELYRVIEYPRLVMVLSIKDIK